MGNFKQFYKQKEMIKSDIPRKKDIDTFSKKANMIFDNMSTNYVKSLKNLCERYESEISDIYKLDFIKEYKKNKFKGMNKHAFTKISKGTIYHKGKRFNNKRHILQSL